MSTLSGEVSASVNQELMDTARAVFADHPAEVGDGLPERLWAMLTELGLVGLGLPEAAGGSGGELIDTASLLLVSGEAAAPVPLAETELAGWLLHGAGLEVPRGPLAYAVDNGSLRVEVVDGEVSVRGELPRVGWAAAAAGVALLVGGPDGADRVLRLDPVAVRVEPGRNVAGEPRDTLRLDTTVTEQAVAPPGCRELLARRAALFRALLMAGAAGRALAQSVRYAGERIQFGRPIAKFQAIQQQLALAAAEVAAGRAAAEAAVRIAAVGEFAGADAELAVAVAKARAGEAAGAVARIAHQVHGAIGFTLEHDLRLSTTRLWAWRDEDGSDAHWHAVIGRRALTVGADGLWPMLTSGSAPG